MTSTEPGYVDPTGTPRPEGSPYRRWAPIIAVTAMCASGCATYNLSLDQCPAYPPSTLKGDPEPTSDEVKIRYLGSGGYLISRGSDVVLFGPVFSNPSMVEIAMDHAIRTDSALVEVLLPKEADKAQAIIVGHSHYDHLMDTPYIAERRAKSAANYGSLTTAYLMRTFPGLSGRSLVPLEAIADADPDESLPCGGKCVSIGPRMRLWPIRSEHSDQLRIRVPMLANIPVHMWRGDLFDVPRAPPRGASDWPEGPVFAYLLDFLDANGQPVFRVYYQDSGTDREKGFPPTELLADKAVDVALLCVGGDFKYLKGHPEEIIGRTMPRFVILGHWEDLFVTQREYCRRERIPGIAPQGLTLRSDTSRFLARAKSAMRDRKLPGEPILPCPIDSVFYLPIDKDKDAVIHDTLKRRRTSYNCQHLGLE